jgi:hypothetical protein
VTVLITVLQIIQPTTQSTVDKPPVWDESLPLTVSELGTRFNLNIPVGAVTDDVEVSYYEVYVNHELSTFRTISDTRLFVSPKNDMTCWPTRGLYHCL